jgi:hypothetical protein
VSATPKKVESDSAGHRIPLAMTQRFTAFAVRYTASCSLAFDGPDFGIVDPKVATSNHRHQLPEEIANYCGAESYISAEAIGTAHA